MNRILTTTALLLTLSMALVAGNRKFKLEEIKPGVYSLDLKNGEEAVLWSGGKMPELILSPVAAEKDKLNSFGLR